MKKLFCLVVLSACTLQVLSQGCADGSDCVDQSNCQTFLEKKKELKELSRGSERYIQNLELLRSLVCNKKDRKVCCERRKYYSPSWVPPLSSGECGLSAVQHHGYVVGGKDAGLGEFPWAALLGRKRLGSTVFHCGGSLVNTWYVITAAHCGQVDLVRLGEWRVEDDEGIDCICDKNKRKCTPRIDNVCAPKPQDIGVEYVKIHEDYTPLSRIPTNDIMLIKLKQPARITEFVSPVCLPTMKEIERIKNFGERFSERVLGRPIVTGWGRTYSENDGESDKVASSILQKLPVPVISNAECIKKSKEKFQLDLSKDIQREKHICAGGLAGEDSCKGDSGGGLVGREAAGPFILVGVVSAGTVECGIGIPGIYSRVSSFVPWILQNIK